MGSSPPPSSPPHPSEEGLFLTTAAPPEPAPPDHATPPPPPEQATVKLPEADESPPPPIDGTPNWARPPPSLSPPEVATAATSEEPTSPSQLHTAEAVEASPEATAAAASLPPSPQIAEASPEDAPPPSPPPNPPASTSSALPDASSTDAVAMAPEEASGPPPAPESMDADPHTAPATPTPPLEGGPEDLLPQQQPRPPSSLEMAPPGCESSETAQLPPPSPPPAETRYALPDAAETDAIAVTSEEAAGSPLALEATGGETDTTPVVPTALKSEAEGSLEEPVPRPPSPTIEAEPCSPEMAPPGFENFKSSWLPLPPHTPPTESTHFLLDVAATKAVTVVPEEAAGSLPALKAMDTEMDTAPGLSLPSSESGAKGPLQQPLLRPPSPITQAEPCSPDMPPPGFENFKSSWLPLPTLPPPAETTYALPGVVATKAVPVTGDEADWPVPALEVMDVETDTAQSLLPPLESGVEGLLQQPLLRPASSMAQSAPCSPEMAPPGFENFKSSWPPLPSLSQTAYVLPDAVATEALAVTLEEVAGSPPALEAMDVDMDSTQPSLLPLESGVEGLLQEPLRRPSSPTMQAAPCSPDLAPAGFENFKSSQPLLPSLPLAHTAYTLQDPATTEAVSVTGEAPRSPPSLEVMNLNMDAVPAPLPSSESGAEGSLLQQLPQLPSPMEKGTSCSPNMVHSGYENLESSQLLLQPALPPPVQTPDALADVAATETVTVALQEAPHPPPVSGAMEEGTVPILPPPLESGSEGPLPQLESHAHSPTEQISDTLPDVPAAKSVDVMSEETVQPPPALQATGTSMDSATAVLSLSESGAEVSLPQPQHQPASPTAQAAHCSLDSLQLLLPPPPPCLDKEMAQLVCGSCRDLLAYPRGAAHVQCAGCRTINLVLEAHEVGKVYCGRCETLLMYPFGAPAVKCSLCLFVTEIGERKVRPRVSIQQVLPPQPPELTHQG